MSHTHTPAGCPGAQVVHEHAWRNVSVYIASLLPHDMLAHKLVLIFLELMRLPSWHGRTHLAGTWSNTRIARRSGADDMTMGACRGPELAASRQSQLVTQRVCVFCASSQCQTDHHHSCSCQSHQLHHLSHSLQDCRCLGLGRGRTTWACVRAVLERLHWRPQLCSHCLPVCMLAVSVCCCGVWPSIVASKCRVQRMTGPLLPQDAMAR